MEKERKMKLEAAKAEATKGLAPQTPPAAPIDPASIQLGLSPDKPNAPNGVQVRVLPTGRRNSGGGDGLKVPGFPFMRKDGPKNASSRDLAITKEAPPSNRKKSQRETSREVASAFERARCLTHMGSSGAVSPSGGVSPPDGTSPRDFSPDDVRVCGGLPGNSLPLPRAFKKQLPNAQRRGSGAPVKFSGMCFPATLSREPKNASSRDLTITKEAPPSSRPSSNSRRPVALGPIDTALEA
ncbi:hypothetical protein AB1Y20_007219 [Prymnesium parvum]|uniref:Uncharacterized protein n=1 Tax=Prymnesium parvum TaxID=97485 RepID=A0AB34IUU6_PRYPA|mmetsp:Transcript_26452/g.56032  ORF Transcript_26452/g.56032 Transcript_26452/m.56032 type:complete len:240 (-) Transcript_26452:198-917(-)